MMITNRKNTWAWKRNFLIPGILTLSMFSCEPDENLPRNNVSTSVVSFISETKALGGGVIENGGKTSVELRGVCWDVFPDPTIKGKRTTDGSGSGYFSSEISGLQPGQTYYVRAYATNSYGTSYGENVSFTTRNSELPIVETNPVSNLNSTSLTSGGNVINEGSSMVFNKGICWSEENSPTIAGNAVTIGKGLGKFEYNITGLKPGITYYVRAFASNEAGTGYGNTVVVKPYNKTIFDIDGNEYRTVSIGTQLWTVDNLRVTRYQNGDPIENVTLNSVWNNLKTGAYCDYQNNPAHRKSNGLLYNWYSASDHRNIAPVGWRVATYEDYQVLIEHLGGVYEAEKELISGDFEALPAGKRNRDGNFFDQGIFPYFWTSTEYHEGSTWARYLILDGGELNIHNRSKNYGFSVRCVRND